ncbi:MAG: hypothetical protein V1764_06740, partial [Nitrospirota bacterium]
SNGWVQAHVRVRTGRSSIELLDFDILLSPKDVFTFDLYDDNGATVFASCDTKTLINSGFTPNFDRNGDGTNDCFVLDSTTFPAMLSLILECDPLSTTTEAALANTKKGYVEIIGEGVVLANTDFGGVDKNLCPGPNLVVNEGVTGSDDVTIAGKMLDHTVAASRLCSSTNGIGVCPNACISMGTYLFGRQYYATVSSGIVTRLGMLNAEVADNGTTGIILHKESYDAEIADVDCAAADAADGCYGYVAPSTSATTVTNGADDMNFCLYTDSITTVSGITGVRNKFGAAATFGPTFADLVALRNGTLATTRANLNTISTGLSQGDRTSDGIPSTVLTRTFADSHYFSVPAPNPFDMRTSFAFIFPVRHFIGELDSIAVTSLYDNEENQTTVTLGKFISPGLPTVSTPGDEAALFNLTSPFAEGWIRFAPTATNTTSAGEWEPGSVLCVASTTNTLVRTGSTTYVPGYTGAVFTIGNDILSSSPFQYDN